MTRQDFILLIEGSQRPFRRFLTALCCGDSQLADDLAQEAYMKAWLAIDSLSDRGAFNAWLRRIGYNTFLSHRRALHPTEDVTEARDIAGSETGDSSFRYQGTFIRLSTVFLPASAPP